MPLYSNILSSKKNQDTKDQPTKQSGTGSNASLRLLPSHLLSKRKGNHQPSSKASKQTDGSRHEHKTERVISERTLHNNEYEWDPEDEYDPRMPNSYEILLTEYMRTEEQRLASRRSSLFASTIPPQQQSETSGLTKVAPAASKMNLNLLDVIDRLEDDEEEITNSPTADLMKGTAIAPPPVLSSTSRASPTSSSSTRVVLLQNMVGPGEVDDSLEAETKEECRKYGEVTKCLIYEIPNKSVPDDEAVRIFVEFVDLDAAVRAAADLNGRYFGGRVVRATFYNVDKFHKFELGLPVNKSDPP